MARPTHFLVIFTFLLSLLAFSASAAPTTFAEVEESWQRGLSEVSLLPLLLLLSLALHILFPLLPSTGLQNILTSYQQKDIHTEIGQHPTPSYHSHLPSQQHPCDDSDRETGFQGMLDERTMAVRRKLHNVIGRRGMIAILFGQKKEEVEVEGSEDQEVLRPVRNRRWQF